MADTIRIGGHDENCDVLQPAPDGGPSQKPCNCRSARGMGPSVWLTAPRSSVCAYDIASTKRAKRDVGAEVLALAREKVGDAGGFVQIDCYLKLKPRRAKAPKAEAPFKIIRSAVSLPGIEVGALRVFANPHARCTAACASTKKQPVVALGMDQLCAECLEKLAAALRSL
jgi:hypothetical protein